MTLRAIEQVSLGVSTTKCPSGALDSYVREGAKNELAMSAAELMYFAGAPFAHIVAFREHQRLARKRRQNLEGLRRLASHESRCRQVRLMESPRGLLDQPIDAVHYLPVIPRSC
jgi:hypothetical protein